MGLIPLGGFFFFLKWKNMEKQHFFGCLRPDWGNTALAATAGLGSLGL